jgi:hypothetical protein
MRALGSRTTVNVLLDASVAIPMLCGLLFRPVPSHFSFAANEAYRQATAHDFTILLSQEYLEEVATHMMHAYWDYARIVDLDDDLRFSENAFVAHYANLKREAGYGSGFLEYLESFGLDDGLRRAEFYRARDLLMPRVARLFDRYSIATFTLDKPTFAAQKKAEEEIGHTVQALGLVRPQVLLKHDIRTLAFLYDQDGQAQDAWVLCTWDSLHFSARDATAAQWAALNPSAFADLLMLTAPDDEGAAVTSPIVVAMSLSEEAAAMKGARVWDVLVRLTRQDSHDAELLAKAKTFKQDYLSRARASTRVQDIEREWTAWKNKYHSTGER